MKEKCHFYHGKKANNNMAIRESPDPFSFVPRRADGLVTGAGPGDLKEIP